MQRRDKILWLGIAAAAIFNLVTIFGGDKPANNVVVASVADVANGVDVKAAINGLDMAGLAGIGESVFCNLKLGLLGLNLIPSAYAGEHDGWGDDDGEDPGCDGGCEPEPEPPCEPDPPNNPEPPNNDHGDSCPWGEKKDWRGECNPVIACSKGTKPVMRGLKWVCESVMTYRPEPKPKKKIYCRDIGKVWDERLRQCVKPAPKYVAPPKVIMTPKIVIEKKVEAPKKVELPKIDQCPKVKEVAAPCPNDLMPKGKTLQVVDGDLLCLKNEATGDRECHSYEALKPIN